MQQIFRRASENQVALSLSIAAQNTTTEPELDCWEAEDGEIYCVWVEIIACSGPICGGEEESKPAPWPLGGLLNSVQQATEQGATEVTSNLDEWGGVGMSCQDLPCAHDFLIWCVDSGGVNATEWNEDGSAEMNCQFDGVGSELD